MDTIFQKSVAILVGTNSALSNLFDFTFDKLSRKNSSISPSA